MPLERTPKYDAEIESVRKMSQETVNQKTEKKEAAALLRMETLFDNAQCVRLFVETITNDPHINREEFTEIAKKSGLIVHADAVEAFINKLLETRNKISSIKYWASEAIKLGDQAAQFEALTTYEKKLREQGQSEEFIEARLEEMAKQILANGDKRKNEPVDVSHWLGQQLFRKHLAKSPEPPKGEITLDTSNPLALIMNFSDEDDYKRVDPKDNVGGFYNAEKKVGTHTFPFIAINAKESTHIEQHEVGHAENAVLKDTKFKAPGAEHRRLVWSHAHGLTQKEISVLNAEIAKDLDPQEKQKAEAERQRLENRLLSYALSRAKDELLANYANTPDEPFEYKSTLIKRKDLYDYFKSAGLTENSPTYARLWERYETALDKNCAVARFPARCYSVYKLAKRHETYRWILVQIPLEDWAKQINRLPFNRETSLLIDMDGFERPDRDVIPSEKRAALIKKYHDFLAENETGLLLPGLREIEREQKAIIAEEQEAEKKRRAEAAERGRREYDESLMKIWGELEDYEKMTIDGVRQKVSESSQRSRFVSDKSVSGLASSSARAIVDTKKTIEDYFLRRCEEEGIRPDMDFFASYLDDHNWNSNIVKIRKERLPGWEFYGSL